MVARTPGTGNRGECHADRDHPGHPRGGDGGAEGGLIKGATDLLEDVLNKDPNLTFVIIQEVELENWGVGGLPTPEFRKQMAEKSPE